MSKYALSLFVFRRDLRLRDNTALLAAHRSSRHVLPIFIVDPRQCNKNKFRSNNAIHFMVHSLVELRESISEKGGRLLIFEGKPDVVVGNLLSQLPIEALFLNEDYTPFSRSRDRKLETACKKAGCKFVPMHDSLINPPGEVIKSDGSPYTVFTPFQKRARQIPVRSPQNHRFRNFAEMPVPVPEFEIQSLLSLIPSKELKVRGGRREGVKLLTGVARLSGYEKKRDIPAVSGTSLLSAHNKFGTLSIREVYSTIEKRFGQDHGLISELYWRDFFTHIAWHFPHVFEGAFREKYSAIKWDGDKRHLGLWKKGKTGFPIVDAGMRELSLTGFMHNRVRMIVASFLTKDLHIHWREGERHFAQYLIDYDPSVNNGNWQWAASTGCDAQPYFRVFNPWLQQKRFDPQAIYIKKWIPELRDLAPADIHNIEGRACNLAKEYPAPIVDHSIERERAIERFQQ